MPSNLHDRHKHIPPARPIGVLRPNFRRFTPSMARALMHRGKPILISNRGSMRKTAEKLLSISTKTLPRARSVTLLQKDPSNKKTLVQHTYVRGKDGKVHHAKKFASRVARL